MSVPTATSRPSLPPDFNLSLAIPREQAAAIEPPASDDKPPRAPSVPDIRETVAFMGAPPAGPSPLAIRDAAPVAEPPPPKPIPPKPRFTQKQMTYAAGGVLLLVTVIALIAVATRGDSSSSAAVPVDAAPEKPSTPASTPVDEQLARARDLVAAGKVETALDLLLAARKVFPTDARVAFAVGKLYMDKQWWPHGLRHFRYAIQLDSKFRSDEQLIKSVLKAFLTPRDYPVELGSFLRNEIGAPARPFLEETEQTHPRAHVRARAAAELRKIR